MLDEKILESMDLEALLDNATLIDRPHKNEVLTTINAVDEVWAMQNAAFNVNMTVY